MAAQKRRYDGAFKQDALRLLAISGKSVRQVEVEQGITQGLLNKWKIRYRLGATTGEFKPSEQHDLESEPALASRVGTSESRA
jgi:transposase-like protein